MTQQELKALLISKGVKEEDISTNAFKLKGELINTLKVKLASHLKIIFFSENGVFAQSYKLFDKDYGCFFDVANDLNFDRLMHFYKAFTGK